jgi:hypothetical protein
MAPISYKIFLIVIIFAALLANLSFAQAGDIPNQQSSGGEISKGSSSGSSGDIPDPRDKW